MKVVEEDRRRGEKGERHPEQQTEESGTVGILVIIRGIDKNTGRGSARIASGREQGNKQNDHSEHGDLNNGGLDL